MTHRRWPAEWEPQDAIWLAWPHNPETWPGRFEAIPAAYAAFVRAVAEVVEVHILVPEEAREVAQSHVGSVHGVTLHTNTTNDCWIRDYGPTIVTENGKAIGVDWGYNAWGGKYPPWDADAANAKNVCTIAGIQCETSPLTCEGGALETDGQGRLLTTPECLITDTRNPGWTKDQIAQEFHKRLGIVEILWVDGGGLEGDDTDGHIDQLARFVDSENIVCAVSSDSEDPNYQGLETNFAQLSVWGRETSPPVKVHRLPIPPARFINEQRVPESYCNFLIVGGTRVILPQFRSPQSDAAAVALLQELMPDFEIVPVDASDLAWGLGAFHCASQQQPAVRGNTDSEAIL